MKKIKLVKIISIITGAITIVVIGYSINEADWISVGFFSFLFLGMWIIPSFLKKVIRKNEKINTRFHKKRVLGKLICGVNNFFNTLVVRYNTICI